MTKLRRSLVINFFSSSGAALAQFVTSIILARILSPSEIGVFSMTVVFVNIAHIFRDFGVATYIQQEPDLTPEKLRAAIGVLFTSSWLLAGGLFLSSHLIAGWLNEPKIAPVMQVLAIGFLFIPFGSITNSLLLREFAADKQALVTVAGVASYCVSCIGLALLGFGNMSMAWANLINILVCAVAFSALRPAGLPWLPSFRNWAKVVHFGVGTLIANLASAVNNAVPDMLLGKLGGARLVGLFSRSNSTVSIFTYVAGSTVSYGAVTYLSEAHHRGESMVPILKRATALLTGVGWPALALTAVLGKDIVIALYGWNWVDSVPAILPLTVAAAVSLLLYYTPTAFTAIGMPYLGALPVVVTLATRILFGFALFDGTLLSFSWAICLATIVAAPVMLLLQVRHLRFSVRDNLQAVGGSAVISLACAAAAALLSYAIPHSLPSMVRLCIMALPLFLVWFGTAHLLRHEVEGELRHLLPVLNRWMPAK